MKLKAFDLDFPYVENKNRIELIISEHGCSHNDAIKIDYQTYWKDKRRRLSLQTRCISAFFERLFSPIDTKDCKKILVECVHEKPESTIKNYSGVYTVQCLFDEQSFEKNDDLGKKKTSLDILMAGIKKVASNQNWDIEPFENVYNKIVAEGYNNEWVWQKSAKSPDKKYKANVLLQHEVDRIDILIVIYDKENVIFSKKVISELPDEYAYANHLGSIKWISSNKVSLVATAKDREWTIDF